MNLESHRQSHNNQALDRRPKTQPRPTPIDTDESLEYSLSALWKLILFQPTWYVILQPERKMWVRQYGKILLNQKWKEIK